MLIGANIFNPQSILPGGRPVGYFDGLTDAIFKKDAQGNTIFYPNGTFGKGYVLPSEEQAAGIRRYIKKMYMVVLPAIVIPVAVGRSWGIAVSLLFSAVFIVWYCGFAVRRLTKGLEVSREKLTRAEAMVNSAKSHNYAMLIFLEITSILFVAAGLFLAIVAKQVFVGVISILFFGFCSVQIGIMIHNKRKASS